MEAVAALDARALFSPPTALPSSPSFPLPPPECARRAKPVRRGRRRGHFFPPLFEDAAARGQPLVGAWSSAGLSAAGTSGFDGC